MEVRSGYKNTEVGVIPEDWGISSLHAVADCLDNLRVPLNDAQRQRMQGNIPYCGANGVLDHVNGFVVDDDIILMAEDGGYFDEYASRPIAYRMQGKCWVNNHAHILKAKRGHDQGFLFYSLVHKNILPFLASGTRAKLNKSEMEKIVVPAPPSEAEQRAIAAALSDVDALLGGLDRLIAKKRDLKQAAMQQLLTGQTRLPGFDGEWEALELGDIAAIRNAKAVASSTPAGTQCVELESIDQGTGRLLMSAEATGLASKYSFRKGDVLFGRLRAYLRKYWLAAFGGVCSTEIWPLIARDERLSGSFLHLLVQTNDFVNAAGVSYGTHMPRSDWSVLKKLLIKLPPVPEQTAIAAVLSDMDAELAVLEARRDKTRDLKQAMMQELLTGKTRLVPAGAAHA